MMVGLVSYGTVIYQWFRFLVREEIEGLSFLLVLDCSFKVVVSSTVFQDLGLEAL
jgi:hypothetical protein